MKPFLVCCAEAPVCKNRGQGGGSSEESVGRSWAECEIWMVGDGGGVRGGVRGRPRSNDILSDIIYNIHSPVRYIHRTLYTPHIILYTLYLYFTYSILHCIIHCTLQPHVCDNPIPTPIIANTTAIQNNPINILISF